MTHSVRWRLALPAFGAIAALLATVASAPQLNVAAEDPLPAARIAFATGEGDIAIINPDGSHKTVVVARPGEDRGPSWSPTRSRLIFEAASGGPYTNLWLVHLNDLSLTRLTAKPWNDENPSWSPDGRRIAFAREWAPADRRIVVMNLADESEQTITNFDSNRPQWSPDGSRIVFAGLPVGEYQILTVNADGSGLAQLTNDHLFNVDPAWSPDGSKIAWRREGPGGISQIAVMNADGSGKLNITSGAGFKTGPAWSPDGRWIVFSGEGSLFLVHPDGTGLRDVPNSGWGYDPEFEPLFLRRNSLFVPLLSRGN